MKHSVVVTSFTGGHFMHWCVNIRAVSVQEMFFPEQLGRNTTEWLFIAGGCG